ncbi:MAG: type II CAAX endopeptidase family protein [Vagococcus sp.]|uniref:CPBP family intramembrane glutamic endopeptidase n=1 Tax=Vagococcus sp. TaxID=1933889 RepID=UPI002FC7218E
MSLSKNTLWTTFFFLLALTSPVLFKAMSFSASQITNLTAMMYIISAVILIFINSKTNKNNTLSNHSETTQKVILVGISGIFVSWFLQAILALIEIQLLNQPMGSQNTQEITNLIKSAPFFILAVTIAGPIMEEFVFRFSLINFLNQKLNIWLSAIISSLIFAILHGDGHYLVYTGLGFFFFLLYRKTGSLLTSIITHAGMNTLVIVAQLFFIK